MDKLADGWDTPFLKPGTEYCNHCVGRKGDHAPNCKISEAARNAIVTVASEMEAREDNNG